MHTLYDTKRKKLLYTLVDKLIAQGTIPKAYREYAIGQLDKEIKQEINRVIRNTTTVVSSVLLARN